MSVAVVLFGKVGGLDRASRDIDGEGDSASSTGAGKGASKAPQKTPSQLHADQRTLLAEAHASFVAHVVRPNPTVHLDVFAHSWNPSLGGLIDELWKPAASLHEREKTRALYGGVNARSAFSSIRHALGLKAKHERQRDRPYEMAMLTRYDLQWHAPVAWGAFPRAQVWAVAQCCGWQHNPVKLAALPPGMHAARKLADEACLSPDGGEVMDYCRVSRYQLPVTGALPTADAELNYNLNDWAVFAPSSTLDTWRTVEKNFHAYRVALWLELGIPLLYSEALDFPTRVPCLPPALTDEG